MRRSVTESLLLVTMLYFVMPNVISTSHHAGVTAQMLRIRFRTTTRKLLSLLIFFFALHGCLPVKMASKPAMQA